MSYGSIMSQTPSTLFSLATLHITGPTTGSTVTASSTGGGTQTAKEISSGVWEIEVDKGNWVVKCDGYEDGTVSASSVKVYDVVLSIAVSSVLNNNSWETISMISQQGKATQYWSVGDAKYEYFTDNKPTDFVIVDFNKDLTPSITFSVGKHLDYTYALHKWGSQYIFFQSSIYNYLVHSVLPDMPFKDYAREVVKRAKNKSKGTEVERVKIFLFGEYEVFGRIINAQVKDGEYYAWYKAGNRSKYYYMQSGTISSSYPWWLRSCAEFAEPLCVKQDESKDWNYNTELLCAFGFVI